MFKRNNPTTALNILYIKEKEICPGYISKNQIVKNIILLMISNEEKRKLALSCSKKIICIFTWNNFKT